MVVAILLTDSIEEAISTAHIASELAPLSQRFVAAQMLRPAFAAASMALEPSIAHEALLSVAPTNAMAPNMRVLRIMMRVRVQEAAASRKARVSRSGFLSQ